MPTATFPHTKRLDAWTAEPEKLRLVVDPEHPMYDPRVELPLDENLILNIMSVGVIKPIVVRQDGDSFEVIDGRQRVRAAREANKRLRKEGKEPVRVPMVRRRGDDVEMYGIHVSANEFRRNDDPVAQAKKMQRLLDMGSTPASVAVLYGVTEQTIKNRLALLDVAAPVRHAVESGKLAPTAAAKLSKLPREQQVEAIKITPTVKMAAKAASGATATATPRIRPADELRRIAAFARDTDHCHVLAWVTGEIDSDELARLEPALKPFFAA